MKVITFSRFFPSYHVRRGEFTYFVEKIWKGLDTGNRADGQYSIWCDKHPRLMKDGHWQIPHLWRDKMLDDDFSPKHHTIRAGNRWKIGEYFSPRIWSDKPYRSKQIEFAPPIKIEKIWKFEIINEVFFLDGHPLITGRKLSKIAANDGLDTADFDSWFPKKKDFHGQIISWSKKIEY